MKKWKVGISTTAALLTLGIGVSTALADNGIYDGTYWHFFIGYEDLTSASIQTVSAYIKHGANNRYIPNPTSSIWTMGVNTSNGTFEQTGLVASNSTAWGNPGTGVPVYFFAADDPANGYREIDGSYGSAVGYNHLYSATWKYNGNGTDQLEGYVDGHAAGSFSTTIWPIPNEVQNFMEETYVSNVDGSDGFGSASSPEIFSDMQYKTTGGTWYQVTSGTSSDEGSHEHFMSGSYAAYFGVYDDRN
jgi:hypothetical protein